MKIIKVLYYKVKYYRNKYFLNMFKYVLNMF